MFGKESRMNPLESRKRLLVVESELNRAQLIHEGVVMSGSLRTLTNRVKAFGTTASAAGLLVAGLAALRHSKVGSAAVKPSWLQMIRKGAGLVSFFWPLLRAKNHSHESKEPTSRI